MTSKTSTPPVFPHPLDVFPVFRRIPKNGLRLFVGTLIYATLLGVIFTWITWVNVPTASMPQSLIDNFVFSFAISISVHLLSVSTRIVILRWFPDASYAQRASMGLTAAICGGVFGYWLGTQLLGYHFRWWPGSVVVALWVAATLVALALARRRAMLNELAFERERNARIEAERLMTVSRLQTLQAQIEPHFLFNTLANVSSLIEVEPKQARKMLDELTVLLRAALDSTRKSTTSLRKELQVVEAYLGVLKVRMGERLAYRIDAPEELSTLQVPAMLLQPIVENAVKHGIEPRLQGGAVGIEVIKEDDMLMFVVADNGVGFSPNNKENVGLGVVRERLAVQFGAAATLTIDRTGDNWTRVIIRIPFSDSATPT